MSLEVRRPVVASSALLLQLDRILSEEVVVQVLRPPLAVDLSGARRVLDLRVALVSLVLRHLAAVAALAVVSLVAKAEVSLVAAAAALAEVSSVRLRQIVVAVFLVKQLPAKEVCSVPLHRAAVAALVVASSVD
jgi:hypothetical protein